MKILIDENISLVTIQFLRSVGHDAKILCKANKDEITDELLWQLAQSEQRLLISTYHGFRGHRYWSHFGILIVRLKQPRCCKIHERVLKALNDFAEEEWKNLVVIAKEEKESVFHSPPRN